MTAKKEDHTVRKLAIGSAVAGAVGYLAGVLTAPKSGKETRSDIANKTGDLKESLTKELGELNQELKDLIQKAKDKTMTLSATAKAEFNEAVIRAKDAQNKANQVLKAVKNGEATDPELNKAVKQAQQAAKNLNKFLKT